VQPAFWLTALLLGGGIRQPGLLALWVAVVFVSILVHELGHVTAMRLTGGSGQIVLTAFGGVAIPSARPVEQRPSHAIIISAAGPLAQILLGFLIASGVVLAGGIIEPVVSSLGLPFLRAIMPSSNPGPDIDYLHYAVNFLLYISFFWSLLNLAPVYPLDGGQIARSFLGFKTAAVLSLAVAGAVAAFSFLTGNMFLGLLFVWLAFTNVQALRAR
jgi:Zn-dependent protease